MLMRVTEAEDAALAAATRRRQARSRWIAHAILALGVLVFAFPIWITLVGSTHEVSTIGRGEVPLWFGSEAVANYLSAWTTGGSQLRTTGGVPVWLMLWNSAVMAVLIAVGRSRSPCSRPMRWCSSPSPAAWSASG
jgi:sn-glycerol 3-phosphate transport system permease protein